MPIFAMAGIMHAVAVYDGYLIDPVALVIIFAFGMRYSM